MKIEEKVAAVVARLEARFGEEKWRSGGDPLESLILTVLSQNTSDVNRDRAYQRLRQRFPTWEEVLSADLKELEDALRPGGLAQQKAPRIQQILAWVKETQGRLSLDFVCELPVDEAIRLLTRLPGVGVKTVAVVLAFACGKDVFPVDTHVHRICRRLGFVPSKASAEKTFAIMEELVPAGKKFSFHINLLRHGRTICKAQNPRCWECPIVEYCQYEEKEERLAAGPQKMATAAEGGS